MQKERSSKFGSIAESSETSKLLAYLAILIVCSALPAWWMAQPAAISGSLAVAILIGLLAWMMMSETVQQLMHLVICHCIPARQIDSLHFDAGIPDAYRCAVVVPVLLGDEATVDRLLIRLKQHRSDNPDLNLRFVLLTDFVDSPSEETPSDRVMLGRAVDGIKVLNLLDDCAGRDFFFLMHRPRKWSAAQGVWMGRERKRGKLMDFNAFLIHGSIDAFSTTVGDLSRLDGVKYVITLDADTGLPAQAASDMVAAIAHPAHRPCHDGDSGVVVSGYALLQPRMKACLRARGASAYERLANDLPPPVLSDVPPVGAEQRLWGTSAYFGKGIYDVAAFEHAMAGRLPDDWVLSHDLVEGNFLRCASLCSVVLTETLPPSFEAEMKRRHRWTRGDWQNAPWLLPRIPNQVGSWEASSLSWLSRWRVADNLRRSAMPVATLMLLFAIAGGLRGDGADALSILLGLSYVVPLAISNTYWLFQKHPRVHVFTHLRYWLSCVVRDALRTILAIGMLPTCAIVSLASIGTALWRMLVSRQRMLAWVDSSRTEAAMTGRLLSYWRFIVTGLVAALAMGWTGAGTRPVLFLVGAWALAPLVTWWMGQPGKSEIDDMNRPQAVQTSSSDDRFEVPQSF